MFNRNTTFYYFSLTGTLVALKEITRSEEEGTPFTAIREGTVLSSDTVYISDLIQYKLYKYTLII